jgi:hypothetical protein
MNYNPRTFVYLPSEEDTLFFTAEDEVPVEEETINGKLVLFYSKQKLVYGKTTPEKILNLYEFELIKRIE